MGISKTSFLKLKQEECREEGERQKERDGKGKGRVNERWQLIKVPKADKWCMITSFSPLLFSDAVFSPRTMLQKQCHLPKSFSSAFLFLFQCAIHNKTKTRGCHLILQSLSTKVKQIASTPIHIQCSLCLPSALASSLVRYSNPMMSRLSSSSSSGPEDPSAAEAPGMSMVSLLKLKMAFSETCSSS